jgi:hypothetical protein
VWGVAGGTAAVVGAGQLGIAYGLGLLQFPAGRLAIEGAWQTQLTWTAWFATVAVLAGAAGGTWQARRTASLPRWQDAPGAPAPRGALDLGQRIVVTLVAAAGAGIVIYLTALPARTVTLDGSDPALEAALAGLLGIVAGILVTVAAMSLRVAAVGVTTIIALTWLLALVSVIPTLGPSSGPALVRLGVFDLPAFGDGTRSTVAVLSPVLLALLVGTALAAAARGRGLSRWQTVVAGTAGPGLLALPYLIAPPAGGDRVVQAPAFGGALVAVAIALLAAVIVAVARIPVPGSRAGIVPPRPVAGRAAWGSVPTGATGDGVPVPPALALPPDQPTPPADRLTPPPDGWSPSGMPEPAGLPDPPAPATPTMFPPLDLPAPPAPAPPRMPTPRLPYDLEMAPVPGAAAPPSPPDPEPVVPTTSRKRARRADDGDDDDGAGDPHMDWVRSLAGDSDDDDGTGLGRRRLRRSADLSDPDPPR